MRSSSKTPIACSLHSEACDYSQGQGNGDVASMSAFIRTEKQSQSIKPLLKGLELPTHELLEKVKDLQERLDADMCEITESKPHWQAPDKRVAAYTIKKDMFINAGDKGALLAERDALCREKKDLELLLVDAEKKLSQAAERVKESEYASAVTNSRVSSLDSDVERLCTLSRLLSDENANLRSQIGAAKADIENVNLKKEVVEKEQENLSTSLNKAIEQVYCLRESISNMQADAARLNADNNRLESLLQIASEQSSIFERQNTDLKLRLEVLEGLISDMQNELCKARSEAQKLSHDLEKEMASKEALLEEVSLVYRKQQALAQELELARSCPSQPTEGGNEDGPGVESQISNRQCEPSEMHETGSALEVELRSMTASFSESLMKAEDEMTKWRTKVEGLEAALVEANVTAYTSEKKAWQLLSELKTVKILMEKKSKAATYAMPATAVSSALAAICIFAYIKTHQPGMRT